MKITEVIGNIRGLPNSLKAKAAVMFFFKLTLLFNYYFISNISFNTIYFISSI